MKLAAALVLTLSACMTPDVTDTSAPAEPGPAIHPDVCNADMSDHLTSELWDTGKTVAALWPPNCNITSTQIVIRKSDHHDAAGADAFVAFVVWNDNIVGHIFMVDKDGVNDQDFTAKSGYMIALRTTGFPDRWAGAGGGTDGGIPPGIHPHVDGQITVLPVLLSSKIKPASVAMTNAEQLAAGIEK